MSRRHRFGCNRQAVPVALLQDRAAAKQVREQRRGSATDRASRLLACTLIDRRTGRVVWPVADIARFAGELDRQEIGRSERVLEP